MHQVTVAYSPQFNGFFQVTEVAEVEVQPNHAGHIIGVVAALEDTLACGSEVRGGTVQRDAQFMPALWDGNCLLVFEKSAFVAVISVERQVVDGVFLAFGPKTLASHIAPHRRQHIETDAA